MQFQENPSQKMIRVWFIFLWCEVKVFIQPQKVKNMQLSNFIDSFQVQFKLSNFIGHFPTSFVLSNFRLNFPTSARAFQLRRELSNFILSNFILDFPT